MSVMVVLTNYKRPENLPECIRAWRAQSVQPDHLVVVDNSPKVLTGVYPNDAFEGADDVWRWTKNSGCPCHFAPAFLHHEYKYTLFADDDFTPGPQALEYLLCLANCVHDRFATIGQLGRKFNIHRKAGQRYDTKNSPRVKDVLAPCHTTCRTHLVQTDRLYALLTFRKHLVNRFGGEAQHLVSIHDDMLLALGLQYEFRYPSYVIPENCHYDQLLIQKNLPEPEATWKRPEHFAERHRFVDMAMEFGWRPVGNGANHGT